MTSSIENLFDALADPTPLRIVEFLRAGPRRAGDLAQCFDSSAPTISRHLRVLRRAGVLDVGQAEDDARARVYGLRPETFIALQAWVDHAQAQLREQLTAFAQHAEHVAGSSTSASRPMRGADPDASDPTIQKQGDHS